MARTLSASVGIDCANRSEDVRTIQELLNKVPASDGGPMPPIAVDGRWGSETVKALEAFQLKQFGWPGCDGKAFPNGETLQALNRFDTSGGGASVGLPFAIPVSVPPPDVSQAFRIRAVRCGVQEITGGIASDSGYNFELHDATNRRVTVFTVVNSAGMNPQFSGKPKVQYRAFSSFRTNSPFRLENFRDAPTKLTIFFGPTASGGASMPTSSRLELTLPGEKVMVTVEPFPDGYDTAGVVSSQFPDCTFRLDFLPGTWTPKG